MGDWVGRGTFFAFFRQFNNTPFGEEYGRDRNHGEKEKENGENDAPRNDFHEIFYDENLVRVIGAHKEHIDGLVGDEGRKEVIRKHDGDEAVKNG